MKDKDKKRDRSVNFTREETETLLSLIEPRKIIIETKQSDAITWQEKDSAWRAIETEYNSWIQQVHTSGVLRKSKHLKLKYEGLKRDTRRKISVLREVKAGGGNGTVRPLTAIEERVKELMLVSDEGDESVYYEWDQIQNPVSVSVVIEEQNEPVPKKPHIVSEITGPSTSAQRSTDKWKPNSEKSKRKKRSPFNKLADDIREIMEMQRKVIREEISEKSIKNKILQSDLEHKRLMHKLEKEQMLLKIEILKVELEHAK